MDIQLLSRRYKVTNLEEKDIPAIFQLCSKNPQYYRYCPPVVSVEGIREDMRALPPGKSIEDKYYLGFWDGGELVAVMDLIPGYPNAETAWIGFFMMNADMQGRGIGSGIIEEVCTYLRNRFSSVHLGYVNGNRQSESFWLKNGFQPTGAVIQTVDYEIIVMRKVL